MHFPLLVAQISNELLFSQAAPDPDPEVALAWLTPFLLIVSALAIVTIVALWRLYQKAGRPGWASIVPIYNSWVMAEIAGKPGYWAFLMFIPLVNVVLSLIIAMELAKKFGKSEAFGVVALWLFGPVGQLILGFGSAQYEGRDAAASNMSGPASIERPVVSGSAPNQITPETPASSQPETNVAQQPFTPPVSAQTPSDQPPTQQPPYTQG